MNAHLAQLFRAFGFGFSEQHDGAIEADFKYIVIFRDA